MNHRDEAMVGEVIQYLIDQWKIGNRSPEIMIGILMYDIIDQLERIENALDR